METENYWRVCLEESFSEHGIAATAEQIEAVASDIEGAASVRHEACGLDRIPDPREAEIARLKSDLAAERSKTGCPVCGGRGRLSVEFLPGRYATSDCDACHGHGKVPR